MHLIMAEVPGQGHGVCWGKKIARNLKITPKCSQQSFLSFLKFQKLQMRFTKLVTLIGG